jgi:hypothetical protein
MQFGTFARCSIAHSTKMCLPSTFIVSWTTIAAPTPIGSAYIFVRYHNKNDGQVPFTLLVGGIMVGRWTANVDDHTWKPRTFTGIFIANGALISIEAAREEGEHARLDYIEVR